MTQEKRENLLNSIAGAFMGGFIGDAMGFSTETWYHKQILERTKGQGVQGFEDPAWWRTDEEGRKASGPGARSDDTEMTLATARSLIRCGMFELDDMACELIKAAIQGRGWGRTTLEGLVELLCIRQA